jgi:hypothetical protein
VGEIGVELRVVKGLLDSRLKVEGAS